MGCSVSGNWNVLRVSNVLFREYGDDNGLTIDLGLIIVCISRPSI